MQVTDEGGMDREFVEQAGRWLIGGVIACAALVGVVLLVGAVVVALDPPMWIAVALGTVLSVGAAAFAWLVATALGSRSEDARAGRARRLPPA